MTDLIPRQRGTAPLCPVEHDDEQREAADGLALCRACVRQMRRDIESLPGLHHALEQRMAQPGGATSGRVSGTTDPQINLDARIVKARDNIAHDLDSWCRVVADDRGLTGPSAGTLLALAAWLSAHVDWLAAQPFALEVAVDFRTTSREAYNLAYPTGRRRVPIFHPLHPGRPCACPHDDCVGVLTAFVSDVADLLPSRIVCDADEGHVWGAREWVGLGRVLHARQVMEEESA